MDWAQNIMMDYSQNLRKDPTKAKKIIFRRFIDDISPVLDKVSLLFYREKMRTG